MGKQEAGNGVKAEGSPRDQGTPQSTGSVTAADWATRITSDGPVSAVAFTKPAWCFKGGADGEASWPGRGPRLECLEARVLFDMDNPWVLPGTRTPGQGSDNEPGEEEAEDVMEVMPAGQAFPGISRRSLRRESRCRASGLLRTGR